MGVLKKYCTKPFCWQSKGNTQQRKDFGKISDTYNFNHTKHICACLILVKFYLTKK